MMMVVVVRRFADLRDRSRQLGIRFCVLYTSDSGIQMKAEIVVKRQENPACRAQESVAGDQAY
jgi:hypothetical protein